jgi:hypothetical protein
LAKAIAFFIDFMGLFTPTSTTLALSNEEMRRIK